MPPVISHAVCSQEMEEEDGGVKSQGWWTVPSGSPAVYSSRAIPEALHSHAPGPSLCPPAQIVVVKA